MTEAKLGVLCIMTLKSQITLCKVMGEIKNTMLWQSRYREYYVMTGKRQSNMKYYTENIENTI